MGLKLGLVVNPIAGIGGRVGLKGSDGEAIQQQALALGAKPFAGDRVKQMLNELSDLQDQIVWYCAAGAMGEDWLTDCAITPQVVYQPQHTHTMPQDTTEAAIALQNAGVDIMIFVGGDGTARDVMRGLNEQQLCLGIPAGCKIYSGVFSITPESASLLIRRLLHGELFNYVTADVLDIDEQRYRQGIITTRLYGEMLIPESAQFMQSVKVAGRESEDLVKEEIAAWFLDTMDDECLYIIGSGSICMAIKEHLGMDGTLIGVDAFYNGEQLAADASEQELMALIGAHQGPVRLIITPIGGQGILLGRGNHQICHKVIKHLGMANTLVVASKAKLKSLEGRPLRLDTGDKSLNDRLSGFITVMTGYEEKVLYQLAAL